MVFHVLPTTFLINLYIFIKTLHLFGNLFINLIHITMTVAQFKNKFNLETLFVAPTPMGNKWIAVVSDTDNTPLEVSVEDKITKVISTAEYTPKEATFIYQARTKPDEVNPNGVPVFIMSNKEGATIDLSKVVKL